LSWDSDAGPFVIVDGIPLVLSVDFNKSGLATDIAVNYDRKGDVTKAQCLEISDRLLDFATMRYGPFISANYKTFKHPSLRKTPKGNEYIISNADTKDVVAMPMRTTPATEKYSKEKSLSTWDDQRYVSFLATFLQTDIPKNFCMIRIGVSEPEKVQRAPPPDISKF
jgi:hypothetical protein